MTSFQAWVVSFVGRQQGALRAFGVAGLLGVAACLPTTDVSSGNAGHTRVRVATPVRRDVVRKLNVAASLDPWQQVTLYAKASGFVRQLRVDRGDTVKKGQLLVVLDVPEAYNAIARARAELEQAEITAKRLAAIRRQEPGAVSQQELDSANQRRAALEASAQTELSLASYSRLLAPFDGVVTDRYVDVGALVAAGTSSKATPVLRIIDASKFRVIVDVPGVDVAFVKNGNLAELEVDAYPDKTFRGVVARRAEALDPATRTMRVEVEIENKDGELMAGMFGRIRLDLETRKDVLTIDPMWMKLQKDQPYVFVAKQDGSGHIATRVNVQTGADDGKFVEIREGLSETDRVIVATSAPLRNDASIEIANAEPSVENSK